MPPALRRDPSLPIEAECEPPKRPPDWALARVGQKWLAAETDGVGLFHVDDSRFWVFWAVDDLIWPRRIT